MTNTELEFEALLKDQADLAYNKIRNQAYESFQKLGIPTIKNEEWKYSSLKGLDKYEYSLNKSAEAGDFDLEQLPFSSLEAIRLVFINGKFSKKNSSDLINGSIKVLNFKEAEELIPEVLAEHYGKSLDIANDGLSALNVALSNEGVVIYVPDNSTLETPVLIQHINSLEDKSYESNVHHLYVVGKNAEAKFAEIFMGVGPNSAFNNVCTEIFVGKDARADYYKIQDENDAVFHVGTTQVTQAEKSYFYAATFTVNGGFVRNNLNLVLDGEYIESHMYGLYIPNGKQHVDNHTLVDHRKPNCESNELYKGILDDNSKGVFNGKIFVREDAQKTNAYQNCRNVILSDSAAMNTKPQLEIWADDVKCSHGTTTGKLNEEAIFYMQSRGIPKQEAIKLQLVAFAEDVVSQIKWAELREELDTLILKKLQ